MGALSTLRDFLLPGRSAEVSRLTEAARDGKLLARRVEDGDFGDLGGTAGGEIIEVSPGDRRELVKRSFDYYFKDPIIRRVVDLKVWYALGSGFAQPDYRDDTRTGDDDDEATLGNYVIARLWRDPENRRALTSGQAQVQRAIETECSGNFFLAIFPSDERPTIAQAKADKAVEEPATVKLAVVPEREIVQIVTHPENRAIPLYYRREFVERTFDFDAGTYKPGRTKVLYYRDWQHEPPTLEDGTLYGPTGDGELSEAVVMHVKPNAVGDMMFGLPGLTSVLDWAKGLNAFANSRMAVINAIAQLAYKVKTKGGQRQVRQAARALQDVQRLAGDIDGGAPADRRRTRQDGAQNAKAVVENEGQSIEPAVGDTGAQSATTDGQFLKGQVAAGAGIPLQHLGDSGNSITAVNGTSMDGPLLVMCEASQELWRTILRDVAQFAIERAGLDPDKVEVPAPPIVRRDVQQVATTMLAASTALDPTVANRKLTRFLFGQILAALNVENAPQIIDETFGEDWETPADRKQREAMEMQAATMGAMGGAPPPGDEAAPEEATGPEIDLGYDQSGTDPESRQDATRAYTERAAVLAEAASALHEYGPFTDDVTAALADLGRLLDDGVEVDGEIVDGELVT